jgi:hypothetical protein
MRNTALTQSPILAAGKIPAALLAQLLQTLPTTDPALLLGPSVGEDAAVIDFAPSQDDLLWPRVIRSPLPRMRSAIMR